MRKGYLACNRRRQADTFVPKVGIDALVPDWLRGHVRQVLANDLHSRMAELVELLQNLTGGR